MHIAFEIILELSTAQTGTCPRWPHPWDHYQFLMVGQTVWLAYRNLDSEQRAQIRDILAHLKRRPGELTGSTGHV